jgi:hypothetical protein
MPSSKTPAGTTGDMKKNDGKSQTTAALDDEDDVKTLLEDYDDDDDDEGQPVDKEFDVHSRFRPNPDEALFD